MSPTGWNVPLRIETERLVLRRYEASDADAMTRVVTASRHYLAQWMPWARDEPVSSEDRVELIDSFMRDFDNRAEFVMGMFSREDGDYMGSTGLHTRLGEGILELGYWLAADRQRQGFATEAAVALTQVGLDFADAERIEIHHLPRNLNSRAIPERCGYTYEGRHKTLMPGVDELEATDIWVATPESLDSGLLATTARPRLFDGHGTLLEWPC